VAAIDNKPSKKPYTSADVIRLAHEAQVCITTVRAVLDGGTPSGRPRGRVYQKLLDWGKEHWIQKPAGKP
jgi:hypothetical protein